ncbi:MAG: DUF2062 domain-containing protein [Chryseolinea sp.]
MGIFPIWGFQLVTAIALSFMLKLNKALVIIAANISIFPPLIIFLSYWVGTIWMGADAQHISFNPAITLDSVKNNVIQYLLGAVTLAIASGIIFGGMTWILLKILKRPTT